MRKAMLLVTIFTFVGCGTSGTVDEVDSVQAALEMEDGGFDDGDEAPQFGEDAEFAEALDPENLPEAGTRERIHAALEMLPEPDVTDPCDVGGLIGRYIDLRPGMGVGRGIVVGAERSVIGHIKLIWGTRRNGTKVAFGKYINLEGRTMALFAGRADEGQFEGRWVHRSGDQGGMCGRYGDPSPELRAEHGDPHPNAPGGVFAGRWAERTCAAE
jgi:hypothetical protein